jgi:hypothetical protein
LGLYPAPEPATSLRVELMTDIRTRLALALQKEFTPCLVTHRECLSAVDALLSLPGIAIVKLPGPNTLAIAAHGLVEFRIGGGDEILYKPAAARRIAAALLAGADAAEES